MPRFGLIGYPLGHSFSAALFQKKWAALNFSGYHYELMPLKDVSSLRQLVSVRSDLEGFNVTIPHKQTIIPFLDGLTDEALMVGSVNTVKVYRKGSALELMGHNTDVVGIRKSLQYIRPGCSALVFGSGGASAAVRYVLKEMKIPSVMVSRVATEDAVAYDSVDLALIATNRLLINCTPVGMAGFDTGLLPLPYEALTPDHQLFDLVYNPSVTPFLKRGLRAGATCIGGYRMLVAQAEAAWAIWTLDARVDDHEGLPSQA